MVTSTADSGPGTFRAAAVDRTCWQIRFAVRPDRGESPIVIAHTVDVFGGYSGRAVADTEALVVGVDQAPFAAIPRPLAAIVNRGPGDGITVTADGVNLSVLAVRGTTTRNSADVAVRGVDGLTSHGLVLGVDSTGITAPPTSDQTKTATFIATDSSGIFASQLVSGWTAGGYWGTVVFQATTSSTLQRSAVVGSGVGTRR